MSIGNSTIPPLVTVVVPSFNEDPKVVRTSLESIRNQTFENFECIVVDESSNPMLAEACRCICAEDSRFIYINPSHRLGLSKSLNLAISQARGEFIARFDSDDVCMPQRLALQVAYLQSHSEISVVGGALKIINESGEMLAHRRYPLSSAQVAKGMHFTTSIAHPTVMFRRKAIENFGNYNPDYRFSEDLELWLRWLNAGLLFANLEQVLVLYRQNNSRRNQLHWRYNLNARVSNFSSSHFFLRTLGIVCIATWAMLPHFIKINIYKIFILTVRNPGGG